MPQTRNKFDKDSLIKILKGACIAGGAVILLYLLEGLIQLDFGSYTALVVGILSVLINSIKEYRKGIKADDEN